MLEQGLILIRQATAEDALQLVEAEKEIAQEAGYFCSQPSELNERDTRQTIESSQGIYLVAEKKGSLVGHAFLEVLGLKSLCHVAQLNIVVHKGYQGHGIGTLLMKELIKWAKQSETVEKIELSVRTCNLRAIALYKKMGFYEEGCLKRRVKVGNSYFDDILMALHIKGEGDEFPN